MLSFSLVLFQGPQILVAMVSLQRVPGGGGGQGADTAAVSAISDARHPRGTVAGAHWGGGALGASTGLAGFSLAMGGGESGGMGMGVRI